MFYLIYKFTIVMFIFQNIGVLKIILAEHMGLTGKNFKTCLLTMINILPDLNY